MKSKTLAAAIALFATLIVSSPAAEMVSAAPSPIEVDCMPDPVGPAESEPVGTTTTTTTATTTTTVPGSADTGSISGIVGVEGGETLEGISMSAYGPSGFFDATTDADGVFDFTGLAIGDWQVFLSEAGYPEVAYCGADVFNPTPITLTTETPAVDDVNFLIAPGVISGRVTSNGVGIENVSIFVDFQPAQFRQTSTDANGNYVIAGLPAETTATVSASTGSTQFYFDATTDYSAATPIQLSTGSPSASNIDFAFGGGGFSGTVTEAGAGFNGDIYFEPLARDDSYHSNVSNGAFAVEYVPAGDYSVRLYGSNDIALTGTVSTDGASITALDLVVPTGSITGTVTRQGETVDLAMWSLQATTLDGQVSVQVNGNFDGTYSVNNLADGTYTLSGGSLYENQTVYHPGTYDVDGASTITITSGSGAIANIDVPVAPGVVAGSVTSGGSAVTTANVALYGDNYEYIQGQSTDGLGAYSFDDLGPGNYRVQVSASGASFWNGGAGSFDDAPAIGVTEDEPTSTENDFDLPAGGFSGTLLDESGNPYMDYFNIQFQGDAGAAYVAPDMLDGSFSIAFLSAGDYQVTADIAGETVNFGTFTTDGLSINSGLALTPPTGSISGTVVRNDLGVDGSAQYRPITLTTANGSFSTRADLASDGTFTVGHLAAGDYYLSYQDDTSGVTTFHPNGADIVGASVISLADGETLTLVDIELPPTGTITGRVIDASGATVPGATVSFNRGGGASFSDDTNDPGQFDIDLPYGTYSVTIYVSNQSFPTGVSVTVDATTPSPTLDDIVIPGGQLIGTLDFGDLPTGSNLFYYLSLYDSSQRFIASTLLPETGDFDFAYLAPGTYTFRLQAGGGEITVTESANTDGLSATADIALTLPSGSISGVVTDDGALVDGTVMDDLYSFPSVSLLGVYGQSVRSTTVGADGSFSFGSLPDGIYKVQAFLPTGQRFRYHPATLTLADSTPIEIVDGNAVATADVAFEPGPGSFTGTVTLAGSPIEGVIVVARRGDGAVAATAATADDGTYTIDGLDPGNYTASANYNGVDIFHFATATSQQTDFSVADATVITGIDINIPTGSFSGTLSDAGNPLGNTSLDVYDVITGTRRNTATAPDGSFEIANLPAGEYQFSTYLDGFTTPLAGTFLNNGVDSVDDLALLIPTGSISGSTTQNGLAVDGSLTPVSVTLYDSEGRVRKWTTVDSNGGYAFTSLPNGTYRVSVFYIDHGNSYFYGGATDLADGADIAVSGNAQVVAIDIVFPDAGTVTGKLTDTVGAALSGRQVSLGNVGETGSSWSASTTTRMDGAYTIDRVPVGSYTLNARVDGVTFYAPGVTDPASGDDIIVEVDQTTIADISVPTTTTVSGTVTGPDGPVPGVSVFNVVSQSIFGGSSTFVGTTDANGNYTTDPIRGGSVSLLFSPPESTGLAGSYHDGSHSFPALSPLEVSDSTPLTGVDVSLGLPGVVTGTITNASAEAVSAHVQLIAPNSTPGMPSYEFSNRFDDGTYEFVDVPPGQWLALVTPIFDIDPQFADTYSGNVIDIAAATPIELASAGTVVSDVQVVPGETIVGAVTGPDGLPLIGQQVSAQQLVNGNHFPFRSTRTRADGTYELTGLAAGTSLISVIPQGYGRGILGSFHADAYDVADATPVTTTSGGPVQTIDFQLDRAIGGTVTVFDSDGPISTTPSSPIGVSVCEAGAGSSSYGCNSGPDSGTTVSGATGYLAGLRPGSYDIRVRYGGAPNAPTTSFTVALGDQVSCDIPRTSLAGPGTCTVAPLSGGGTVSGTILGTDGRPQGGVDVSLHVAEYRVVNSSAFTKADGTFVISNVPAGTYRLQAQSNSSGGALYSTSFNEWFSTTDDAYNYGDADEISVDDGGVVAGIDLRLDRPTFVTATVIGESEAAGTVVACDTTIEFNSPDCLSGYGFGGGYAHFNWDGTSYINGAVLPGTYNIGGARYDPSVGGPVPYTETATVTVSTDEQIVCTLPLIGEGTAACSIVGNINASDDGYATPEDVGLTVTAPSGVLANDTLGNEPTTVVAFDAVSAHEATVTVSTDGSFTYDPTSDYNGTDTFGYTIADASGASSNATVTVIVGAAPDASDDSYTVDEDTPLVVPDPTNGLLSNDDLGTEPSTVSTFDATSLTGGVVDVADDGTFTYAPALDFSGDDSFSYTVSDDSQNTSTAVVSIAVTEVDDDGVPEDEEDDAPNNGDGNNDGTPDSSQDSVSSLVDSSIPDPGGNGSNYVTISSTDAATGTSKPLASVALITPPVDNPPPLGATPQTSLINFSVEQLAIPTPGQPASQAELEIYLPSQADTYFKYDDTTGTWTDATSLASFDSSPTNIGGAERWRVVLTITDGGFGDDDGVVNGKVDDPGLFALRAPVVSGQITWTGTDIRIWAIEDCANANDVYRFDTGGAPNGNYTAHARGASGTRLGVPAASGAMTFGTIEVDPAAFPGYVDLEFILDTNLAAGSFVVARIAESCDVNDITITIPGPAAPVVVPPSVISVEPKRYLETRSGKDEVTFDKKFQATGPIGTKQILPITIAGRGDIPDDAQAVFMNVTAVTPTGAGFLTIFPCGIDTPGTANVNYGPGDIAFNSVLSKIGTNGQVCVYTLANTDLVIDVNGYVPATPESPNPEPLRVTYAECFGDVTDPSTIALSSAGATNPTILSEKFTITGGRGDYTLSMALPERLTATPAGTRLSFAVDSPNYLQASFDATITDGDGRSKTVQVDLSTRPLDRFAATC